MRLSVGSFVRIASKMNSLELTKFDIILILILLCICACDVAADNNCIISNPNTRENDLLHRLDPLKGNIFTVKDNPSGSKESYVYKIGICTPVNHSLPEAGALQYDGKNKQHILGEFTKSQILGGTNWIMLLYTNGSKYQSHCGNTTRRMQLIFICDPDELKGDLRIIEERNSGDRDCMYLFEMNSKVACTTAHINDGLSGGSVFCILFFTVAGLYFILGFMYQRIVVGAKGLEQIPNYNFWKEVGYLEADGCDFVCRCGPRYESQQYRGIGDHLSREEESERDDQLLTM